MGARWREEEEDEAEKWGDYKIDLDWNKRMERDGGEGGGEAAAAWGLGRHSDLGVLRQLQHQQLAAPAGPGGGVGEEDADVHGVPADESLGEAKGGGARVFDALGGHAVGHESHPPALVRIPAQNGGDEAQTRGLSRQSARGMPAACRNRCHRRPCFDYVLQLLHMTASLDICPCCQVGLARLTRAQTCCVCSLDRRSAGRQGTGRPVRGKL